MKKIIYLAPLALLGVGAKASANQVPTHISNALRIYEQESNQNQPVVQSENEQAKPPLSNGQNQPTEKVEETTHISRLDDGLINGDSSVGNGQASQVMNISRPAIPTKQELSESKDSVAGQYVQVQQSRVAQFNRGSKIYGLNNSGQLSKNNGDGYVITNAGTYNGRAVDIGVTINNVQDKAGSYTTKWSNGDANSDKGTINSNFKYQDSTLVGTQVSMPNLNKTRTRTEYTGQEELPYQILMRVSRNNYEAHAEGYPNHQENITQDVAIYTNIYAMDNLKAGKAVDPFSVRLNKAIVQAIRHNADLFVSGAGTDGRDFNNFSGDIRTIWHDPKAEDLDKKIRAIPHRRMGGDRKNIGEVNLGGHLPYPVTIWAVNHPLSENVHYRGGQSGRPMVYQDTKNVTDTLQTIVNSQSSLGYNYTVGLYDAQTGDLITDLKAEYKSKAGKTATEQDTAMNDAVKDKIQAINANDAYVAYTGTAANDDVTFSKNTVHVNYVNEKGQPINVPGYDIDVDNLTSGNYQVPQNYVLANTNGFKVTKNTHEVNGVTVTDSYNFIDQGHNKVTNNGKTLSVVLTHGTTNVDPGHSGLSNDATNNAFVINDGAKRQINSQSRHFGASGILDLVTNKISMQGDWQLSGKSNFDQVTINNNLVGYGNTIHSNLTFLAL